tara:strand:+ start:5914 stop:6555 length:642 start_codon:yes stop_codon:yes gene_type:complete
MSLYGDTDSNANKTKVETTVVADASGSTVVFVDATEAALSENQERGLTGPGWWNYITYTDTEGNTRHKSELLVPLTDPEANADETQADDSIVADAASAITFSQDLVALTGLSDPVTTSALTVTAASSDSSALSTQWQRKTATGLRWVNITSTLDDGVYGNTGSATGVTSGAATALTITAGTKAALDGYEYRVKITSAGGAEEVTSAYKSITFA